MFARWLCTDVVNPSGLSTFLSCRLIALNKNPGVRPISVCKTLRRIVAKAALMILCQDIIDAVGPRQFCAGHCASVEAAVHQSGVYGWVNHPLVPYWLMLAMHSTLLIEQQLSITFIIFVPLSPILLGNKLLQESFLALWWWKYFNFRRRHHTGWSTLYALVWFGHHPFNRQSVFGWGNESSVVCRWFGSTL